MRSYISRSPPTITARLRVAAPVFPPLTGASSTWAPWARNWGSICRINVGRLVERSTYTAPGAFGQGAPWAPNWGLDFPDQRRGAGGETEIPRPCPDACQNPLRSEGDRLHFGRARQRGEGHLALARHFGRGRGIARTPVNEGPGALVTQVVDNQAIVRLLNIAGHTTTHIA